MMGQQGGGQDRLFYSFNLDDHVPRNHLLRGIQQIDALFGKHLGAREAESMADALERIISAAKAAD